MASQREKRWKHSCARKFAWIKNLGPQRLIFGANKPRMPVFGRSESTQVRGVTNRAERVWHESASGTYIYVRSIYTYILYILSYYLSNSLCIDICLFIHLLNRKIPLRSTAHLSCWRTRSYPATWLVRLMPLVVGWRSCILEAPASIQRICGGADTRCPFVFVFRFFVVLIL